MVQICIFAYKTPAFYACQNFIILAFLNNSPYLYKGHWKKGHWVNLHSNGSSVTTWVSPSQWCSTEPCSAHARGCSQTIAADNSQQCGAPCWAFLMKKSTVLKILFLSFLGYWIARLPVPEVFLLGLGKKYFAFWLSLFQLTGLRVHPEPLCTVQSWRQLLLKSECSHGKTPSQNQSER